MASKKIIERARAALLDTDDLQFDEDSEIEDEEYTDEENDDENGDENVASKNGENDTDQHEKEGEKVLATKSDKKDQPKGKKSSKGVGKKVKGFINAAADPFGIRKTDWKFGLNLGFQASSQKDRGEKGTDDNDGNPSNTVSGERSSVVPLSPDAKQLKILEKENVSLEKLANKYLDGCIQLRQKVAEFSKVEEQLTAAQADKDILKAELLQLKKLHQDSKLNAETQNTKHRNEITRLNSELNLANESLEKMRITNEKQLNEMGRLKKELETMANEKKDLVKQFENTETSLRSEVKQLKEGLQKAEQEKAAQAELILEIQANAQKAEAQISASNTKNMELEQKLRATVNERNSINSLLESSRAKIVELKRAIQILESDASTTTTAQTQSGGTFSCPICGAQFSSLANMQLHAEDCDG